ncbi:sensor histidine kinase [Vibrio sp. JCM 19236]|nr:sensor histidine kinase [Vibrio sp. JCM 19236]
MTAITHWFDNISLKVKFLFCVFIPISLVLVVSTTVYHNTQSLLSDNGWVNHTHKAIGRAEELLSLVDKMEYGHSGAVLTNETNFAEKFTHSLAAWPNKLATLANQVDDNPDQVQRLHYIDSLHKQWLSMVSDKVNHPSSARQSNLAFMEYVPKMPEGERYAAIKREIKSELTKFIRIEKKLIYKRINASKESADTTTYTLIFGSLLIILISSLVAIMASHRLNKRLKILLLASNEMKDLNLARGVNMLQNKAYFRSKDEISTLTSSFYSLAQSLQGSYKEMELKNRRLEEEKRKAEKATQAKSDFLSTMSHEIRTPLNGVLGLAQIIKDESKEASTIEHSTIILESGQHLLTILNDILDYSKIEENKLTLEQEFFNVDRIINCTQTSLTISF